MVGVASLSESYKLKTGVTISICLLEEDDIHLTLGGNLGKDINLWQC